MLDDGLEERLHGGAGLVDLAHGVAVLCRGVDDGEIELEIGGVQFEEKLENHVQHLVRAGVLAVDLVDDDDRLGAVFERLLEDELRLRLRAVVGIDHQQHAVDHLHDALDLAAEIGMAGGIDDVDVVILPLEGGVLGADGDALLALEVHGVHDALLDLLIGPEGARLAQELIDERGLAVIDVGDDGDVANMFHFEKGREYGGCAGNPSMGVRRERMRLILRALGNAFFIDRLRKNGKYKGWIMLTRGLKFRRRP